MLTWSGTSGSASGVRNLTHGISVAAGELFTMPVEFVSMEMDNRYVNFRVPVPRADVEKMRALSTGEWITATSSHELSDESDVVAAIRPYTSVG